jgi:predicted nuclease of predicted toxin-antitoxin system
VRLLLDAHLSHKKIAPPLRSAGHDVLALSEDRRFDAWVDEQVLELAVDERRILVTRNAKDFAPILRTWAEASRHHPGVILIWSLPHDRYAAIVRGIVAQLTARPTPAAWRDLTISI